MKREGKSGNYGGPAGGDLTFLNRFLLNLQWADESMVIP